ncbi:TetR/AcrR family transcriptional regulator [Nonomuraea sp. 3-1Str]|uniref:TetR/AcrR family transcriptional regulator n=1 Tax=Nonomuraea sp. 3-1Str TaxID=2929801 RepID=UPI002865EA58|nr:helix-turn-helix domain-containing protein [Nonomuraea sp. 3-1Str]MDR8411146.1 TetR/AcrR family transcriptional regulator [Nonomuraea sp. 3-1Str]
MSRDQIMSAAIRHLNADPAASMAQIAEAAGVSRATLHRHFSSREDLMVSLGHRARERWADAQTAAGITEAVASGEPARLERALHALLTALVGIADEYGFGLADHALVTHPELLRRFEELEEREVALYTAAQQAGLLRADLPARWLSSAVFGLLVAARESLRRGDIARREVPRLLLGTFLYGTAARPTEDRPPTDAPTAGHAPGDPGGGTGGDTGGGPASGDGDGGRVRRARR